MVATPLVEPFISKAREIAEFLVQRGFDVTAAFWAWREESASWELFIASASYETRGIHATYTELLQLVEESGVSLGDVDVSLTSPSKNLVKIVMETCQVPREPWMARATPIYGDLVYSQAVLVYVSPNADAASNREKISRE